MTAENMADTKQGDPNALVPSSAVSEARPLVLVTDDDRAGRYALVHPLKLSGFRVVEAVNGEDTLRLAAELRPDAVVLDINLPDIDGREVCRRLKASPDLAAVPIVQVSATNRSDEDWASALDRGADVFLPQPVPPAVLIATLNALLRTREAERRLEETLHSITDAYLALDDEWRFLAMNRRAEEIFGWPWAAPRRPRRRGTRSAARGLGTLEQLTPPCSCDAGLSPRPLALTTRAARSTLAAIGMGSLADARPGSSYPEAGMPFSRRPTPWPGGKNEPQRSRDPQGARRPSIASGAGAA